MTLSGRFAALCALFLAVVLSLLAFTIRSCLDARRADRATAREVFPELAPAR